MAGTVETPQVPAPSSSYRPSWPDRVADGVERLPGPAWCYYLGAWAVLFGTGALLAWHDFSGAPAFAGALRYYAVFTGLLAYVFALRHYLRLANRAALAGFRPVYRETDSVSGQVVSQEESIFLLTNSPAAATLLWSLVAMAGVAALIALRVAPFQRLGVSASALSYAFNTLMELVTWGTVGATAYMSLRTLRLVSRFYARHALVSLFDVQPLYAFSALTARHALGVLVGPLAFFGLEPDLLGNWASLSLGVATIAGTFILFVAPLVGAHRMLVAEQNALLRENVQRLREALDRLHDVAAGDDLTHASSLERLLSGLQQERIILESMRTWPWRPGQFRLFLTALLLPLLIWLLQFVLARLLK